MLNGLDVVRGDITQVTGAAIVRCVSVGKPDDPDGDAILCAGGPALVREIAWYGRLVEARPVVTGAWRLLATAVIHVAAPRWRVDDPSLDQRLALVVERVLLAAVRHGLPAVAFSPIGPDFPMDRAAAIAIGTGYSALFAAPDLRQVTFVCPTDSAFHAYEAALRTLAD